MHLLFHVPPQTPHSQQLAYDTNDMGDAFGLCIRPLKGHKIAWWYTGKGCTGPDNVEVVPGKPIDNGFGDEQLRNVTLEEIARRVRSSKGMALEVNGIELLTFRPKSNM